MKKRLALYATVLALCCAVAALAAISNDFASGQITGSPSMTHTFTNATPANSDRLLLAMFSTNADVDDTIGVVFNTSETMTKNATASAQPAIVLNMQTWYLTGPTAAAHDVVGSTNNPLYSSMQVVALSGVDTSSPFRDADASSAASGSTSSDSLTLTTQSGDFVLDCIAIHNDDSATDPGALSPASGTEFGEEFYDAFDRRSSCTYLTASGSSTSAGAWSWTASSGYAHVAVAIAPLATSGLPVGTLNLLGVGK